MAFTVVYTDGVAMWRSVSSRAVSFSVFTWMTDCVKINDEMCYVEIQFLVLLLNICIAYILFNKTPEATKLEQNYSVIHCVLLCFI